MDIAIDGAGQSSPSMSSGRQWQHSLELWVSSANFDGLAPPIAANERDPPKTQYQSVGRVAKVWQRVRAAGVRSADLSHAVAGVFVRNALMHAHCLRNVGVSASDIPALCLGIAPPVQRACELRV